MAGPAEVADDFGGIPAQAPAAPEAPAPEPAGELGVTVPLPKGKVTEPLPFVRPPEGAPAEVQDDFGGVVAAPAEPVEPEVVPEVAELRKRALGVEAAQQAVAATYGRASYSPSEDDLSAVAAVKAGGDAERKAALLGYFASHTDLNPEDAARVRRAAAATGQSADYLAQHLDSVAEIEKKTTDWKAIAEQHPVLADFLLEDPLRLHQVQDDVVNMTRLERYVTGRTRIVRAEDYAKAHPENAEVVAFAKEHPDARVEDTSPNFWMAKLESGLNAVVNATAKGAYAATAPDLTPRNEEELTQRLSDMTEARRNQGGAGGLSEDEKQAFRQAVRQSWADRARMDQLAFAAAYPGIAAPVPGPTAAEVKRFEAIDAADRRPDAPWRAALRTSIEKLDQDANRDFGAWSRSFWGRALGAVPEMAPFIAGNVAAASVGGPGAVLAFNTQQNFGPLAFDLQQQKDSEGRPVDPTTAVQAALMTSLLVGAAQSVELTPIISKAMGKAVGPALREATERGAAQALSSDTFAASLGRAGRHYGKDVAAGMGVMGFTAGANKATDVLVTGKGSTADAAAAFRDGALEAGPAMALLSGMGAGRVILADAGARARAKDSAARIAALNDAVATAKLLKSSPEEAAAYLKKVREQSGLPGDEVVTAIHVDLPQWQRYWQEQKIPVDPREAAAKVMGDGGKAYDAAVAEHADRIAIPLEKYATTLALAENGTHAAALAPDMALSANVPTPRQEIEEAAKRKARASELAKVEPDAMEAGQLAVFEDYRRQALDAGEDEKVATANAHLYSAAMQTMAERFGNGYSAMDIWRTHPLNIEGPGSEKARQRAHLTQALEDYDAHPAGKAWSFLKSGTGEGDLTGISDRLRAQRLAAGEAPVDPKLAKQVADVQSQIAKLEAKGGGDAGPLGRPSATRRAPVLLSEDAESGAPRIDAHAGGEVPAGAEARAVTLPAWLPEGDFHQHRQAWEWTWSALEGGPAAPEPVQKAVHEFMRRGTESFPPDEFALKQGYALGRLAAGKGGKKFKVLRERLADWAEQPEATRGPPPIPERAWGALIDTTRKDVELRSTSRGFINKAKVERMGRWLSTTRAELDPARAGYRERPPSWYSKAGEEAPAAVEPGKDAARLAELRGQLEDLNRRAADVGRAAPVEPRLDREAATRILGKDVEKLPTTEGGVDPAELARAVGAPDAETLLQDMVARKDRARWAKAQAAERRASGAEPRPRPVVAEASRRLTERLHAMSPEERARELYLDTNTGILGEEGFQDLPADPERPLVAHISIEGTKWLQDHPQTGHPAGDKLYRMAGKALHEASPESPVAKVGGDFAVRVKDQAELDGILARMNERMPVKGFTATGVTGPDLAAAGKAHVALKEEGEGATPPTRALRGQRPFGVEAQEPPQVTLPEAKAGAAVPEALLQRHAAMPLGEAFRRAYLEPGTGALTSKGWNGIPRKAHRAILDMDGLKALNAQLGTKGGDQLLRFLSHIAREHGGAEFDFAHLHGDEYAAQSDDQGALQRFVDTVSMVSDKVRVRIRGEDGTIREVQGIGFSHGIGASDGEAEAALQQHKVDRLAAGKRGPEADSGRTVPVEGEAGGDRGDLAGRGGPLEGGGDPLAGGRAPQDYAGPPEHPAEVGARRLDQAARPAESLEQIRADAKAHGVALDAFEGSKVISLPRIVVPEDARGAGLGSGLMERLADYADAVGKPIALTPATDFGATSKARLVEFYKRFGFVENKGRSRDLSVSEEMYRPPVLRLEQGPRARFDLGGEGRGYVEFTTPEPGKPVRLGIHLLAGDKSTLAHESFHALSIVMGQVASRDDAPAALKANYQRLLDAMGYKDHAERLAAPEAAKEEKASHLWEMYLAEGKAPSAALQPSFTRFKGWMKKLYKGLLGISDQYEQRYGKPIEISDDVRRVFDRMLASDEQVDRARAEREPAAPADLEAMNPVEQAEYSRLDQDDREVSRDSLVRQAAEDEQREARVAARAEAEKIRARVERDVVAQDPGYRALAHLQRGEIPGQPDPTGILKTEKGEPAKLDRKDAVKQLGSEAVAALPKGIFAKGKDGLPLNEMAVRLGFKDSAELVGAIQGKDFDGAVRDEVGKRVEEKFGPALLDDPARAPEAARAAMATEPGAKKLMLRLGAIARELGPEAERKVRGMSIPAMHDQARDLLMDRPIVQVSADRYANMETAAHGRATEAWKAGKKQKALDEVENALWNHVFSRAARDVREQVDAAEQRVRGTRGDPWRAQLGKADPAYRNGHDAILEGMKLRGSASEDPGEAAAARGTALQTLLLRMVADAAATVYQDRTANGDPMGEPRILPSGGWDAEMVQDLVRSPRSWSDLTPDEALNAADAIRNLRHIANDQNEITVEGKRADRNFIIDQIVESLEKNLPAQPKENDDRLVAGEVERKVKGVRDLGQMVDAAQLDMATLAHMVDGGDRFGAFHQIFIDRQRAARDRRDNLTTRFVEGIIPLFEKSGLDRARLYEVLDVGKDLPLSPELARFRKGELRTRANLLMMALELGNDSNAERFLGGYKWTREQVIKVLAKHLNAKEWRWVQDVWNLLETGGAKEGGPSLYSEMAKMHEEDEGLPPGKIKAKPFKVALTDAEGRPTGEVVEMQGGYFPARYDPRPGSVKKQGEKQVARDVADFFQGSYVSAPFVPSPHAKARAAHFEDIVNLDWGTVPAHISQVVQDVAFRRFTRETAALLLNDRFNNALEERLGAARTKILRPWLQAVANARADSVEGALAGLNKTLATFKSKAAIVALGYSLARPIGDLTDPAVGVAFGLIRPGYMARASAKCLANWGGARDFMLANSGEARNRLENVNHRFRTAMAEMGTREGMKNPVLRTVRDAAFWAMELVDRIVITPMWTARYYQGVDAYAKQGFDAREAHQRAVKEADDVLAKVLPPHDVADKPAIMLDRGYLGASMLFVGHANKMGNEFRRQVNDIARAFRTKEASATAKASPIAVIAGTLLAYTVVNSLMAEYFAGRGKTDDETWAEWAERKSISGLFYPVPLVGSAMDAAASRAITGETKPLSIRGSPGFAFAQRAAEGIAESVKKWMDGDGDAGLAAQQAAELLASYGAGTFPVAPRSLHDTLQFGHDWADDSVKPRGPLDVLGGVIYGNDGKGSANPLTDLQGLMSGER